jgi:competence protein ComEA
LKKKEMTWKEFLKDYLSFSRKERIGILIISSLIIFVLFLPEFFPKSSGIQTLVTDTAWINAVKKLELKDDFPEKNEKDGYPEENLATYTFEKSSGTGFEKKSAKSEIFFFDPNTLSAPDWARLGLRAKTITTIRNYLDKGGHFYKPADLKKIYGLHAEEFARLEPFIRIANRSSLQPEKVATPDSLSHSEFKKYKPGLAAIEINSADTTALISLPGIGSKLANRIINFRDKLGGFYLIEQVGETYGLPDSTFRKIKQYLKLDNALVRKININTATVDELKAHPYIKYSLANPIVAYRNEHGAYSGIEDLNKISIISDEIFKKISPYLAIK